MNFKIWILLLFTITAYGQTDTPKSKLDSLYKVIERGDSIIKYQANVIKALQDSIEYEQYTINNIFLEEPGPYPNKRQKTKRWIERVLFFGAIGAVIYLKVKDDD